jgi:hypothetical protein
MSNRKELNMRLLPILSPTHKPQHRQQERTPPLHTEQDHAKAVQRDPEFFKHTYDDPYGVFICNDGTQVLFDFEYRPIWKRLDVGAASRADPAEWVDWIKVYWLHDHDLLPEYSAALRQALALVVDEFVAGRGLWVRRWEPRYAGELVARRPIPPSNVIPFVRDSDPTE